MMVQILQGSAALRVCVQGVSVEQFQAASLSRGRFAGFVSEHGACVRDEEMEKEAGRQTDRQRGWRDNGQRAIATVIDQGLRRTVATTTKRRGNV